MTETAERTGTTVRTVRIHDDAWALIGDRSRDRSPFIRDMADAGLGYVRCWTCAEMVPAEFGDLTGKPLAEWIAEAARAVKLQHRAGHRPVTIGNGADAEPRRQPPASPVFREPSAR